MQLLKQVACPVENEKQSLGLIQWNELTDLMTQSHGVHVHVHYLALLVNDQQNGVCYWSICGCQLVWNSLLYHAYCCYE
jgi:hypothetical protein